MQDSHTRVVILCNSWSPGRVIPKLRAARENTHSRSGSAVPASIAKPRVSQEGA